MFSCSICFSNCEVFGQFQWNNKTLIVFFAQVVSRETHDDKKVMLPIPQSPDLEITIIKLKATKSFLVVSCHKIVLVENKTRL